MGLIVVHVYTITMNSLAKAVPRAVKNVRAVAGRLEDGRRRPVHLPSPQVSAGPDGLLDERHSGIPGVAHRRKGPSESLWDPPSR